ncbi:hypothetical protein [Pseudomonas chlororaphis]|uniref:Uncharacterized protein n=1 Tax=Pseudomonas chlororaphis TaxID=587753 RepID=A0AAX3FUH9_9PSED|nr:hypothetical protein [Pseudomonas chlororaphis]AZC39401.1 hypothetical protein C4K37_5036 [Pseudomonas chlororaphis subsp. piscium]AZC45953.1 hypothetical protein C4K36_5050 [Pseudomonas chlororaphis subsp. piscium]WDG71488.1 hypothetical protein PUP65_25785 [Pseudomonas chlororaphis]WDH30728.1 hypothetical protein PUP81_08535 [Pseudomonas chlororaphis]WDH70013.1 hypothetical protein PUP78_25770 [Pseudomonas chlororaphis]
MSWKLSNSALEQQLERLFQKDGIDFGTPGFYDEPNFLKNEQRDPRYLENYARYVEARSYEADYLTEAKRKIDIAVQVLFAAVKKDGRLGACVDVSGMLGRMLDRLGIWNYVATTTLTIEFPVSADRPPQHFWTFDVGSFTAAHAIVVAPPFCVVDVTAALQAYERPVLNFLPNFIVSETFTSASWKPEDLMNHQMLRSIPLQFGNFDTFLKRTNPQMLSVMKALPARQVSHGETTLKYVIVAVGGTIEPLEGVVGYKPCGRTALTIFDQDILPLVECS